MLPIQAPEFWEERYQAGTTGWDLGQPAPPFVEFLRSPAAPATGRLAVLGCGRGYDALLFAEYGFEVTGFDFAPSAIAAAQELAQSTGRSATFLQRNIFDLVPEFAGQFDYVLEHTCFCAIAPEQRPAYVQLVHDLLRPGGELIGLFFTHSRPGGPPFGSSPAEIQGYFEPVFAIHRLTPVAHSIPQRQGEEHLGYFQAR